MIITLTAVFSKLYGFRQNVEKFKILIERFSRNILQD